MSNWEKCFGQCDDCLDTKGCPTFVPSKKQKKVQYDSCNQRGAGCKACSDSSCTLRVLEAD